MRTLLLFGALLASAVVPGVAPAAASSSWTAQADQVCVVYLAKARKAFGAPVKPAELYSFANKAKALESEELGVLAKLPGRSPSGTLALTAMRADVAEVGAAISAWDAGNRASFVQILKRYLNDHRAKDAFAVAGAHKCG